MIERLCIFLMTRATLMSNMVLENNFASMVQQGKLFKLWIGKGDHQIHELDVEACTYGSKVWIDKSNKVGLS